MLRLSCRFRSKYFKSTEYKLPHKSTNCVQCLSKNDARGMMALCHVFIIQYIIVNDVLSMYRTLKTTHNDCRRPTSPVKLWFDLDKIATETLFIGTDSHTHPEQHIKNIEQSK